MPLLETKGAASAQGFGLTLQQAAANYIEDVFSTYLYTGNGSTQTITNGIDLSTNGGLVWTKSRSAAYSNALQDTVRGRNNILFSDSTVANQAYSTSINSFNTTGYTLGSETLTNQNGTTYVGWTFREQAKFFDVVTYTGNSTAGRTVSHNLGSVPGCIIIKNISNNSNWVIYHRSIGSGNSLWFTTDAQQAYGNIYWNSTDPTATNFTLGSNGGVNGLGDTYVAYLFAHNAGGFGLTGTDNVISCGSFTTDGSGNATVTLGYEPQWLMVKGASEVRGWFINDTMRGWSQTGMQDLFANRSQAEVSDTGWIPTATGFTFTLAANTTYIYIAIRRGPMKTPTSGTSVYNGIVRTGTSSPTTVTGVGFPPDLVIGSGRSNATGKTPFDRLRGATYYLDTTLTAAEGTDATSLTSFAVMDGYGVGADGGSVNTVNFAIPLVSWNFRRAPGFFDEVCYTGTGGANVQNHNLGVAPELVILKSRSTGGVGYNWPAITNTTVSSAATLFLNSATSNNGGNSSGMFTSTTINLGNTTGLGSLYGNQANQSGVTFVAYLFASCPGVSKVGSYTGTGALQTINCGFTSGARFVLIKRTDSTGDWYTYDSARGITSGNDPYLLMNSTAAEVTGTNYVDTDSTGFKVTAAAPAALNANGGTYIFLAIA